MAKIFVKALKVVTDSIKDFASKLFLWFNLKAERLNCLLKIDFL